MALSQAFVDERIGELEALHVNAQSAEDAYAAVIEQVLMVNERIRQERANRFTGAEQEISADVIKRLTKWIKKLRETLDEIAKELGFQSCSISVGGPVPSVSVTVTFGPG